MPEDGAWIHRIYIFLVPFGNTNPADMAVMCSKKSIFLIVALFLPFLGMCKTMRGVKKQGKMRSSFYFDNGGLPELKDELSQFVSFG